MAPTSIQSAIGCTRISTTQQQDGYGQDVQAEEIRKEAVRLGLQLEKIVEEVESGAKSDRETIQQYYDLATARPGLHFIFPRVDRIGRRTRLILEIAEELLKRRAQVHVIGVPGDLRNKESWMMFTMMASMAEYDYRNISSNLHAGKVKKARSGGWAHGKAPYGYRILRDDRGVSTTLEVIPEEAAIVQKMFEMAVDHGPVTIANTLNRLGLPPRAEVNPHRLHPGWSDVTIKQMLKNSGYMGQYVFGRSTRPQSEWVTIPIPAIVTPELFQRVQEATAERQRLKPHRSLQPRLLTGNMACVGCGRSMISAQSRHPKNGQYYRYVHCQYSYPHHAERRRVPVCNNKGRWREEELAAQGWERLQQLVADPARLAEMLPENPPAEDHSGRIQELRAKVQDIWAKHFEGLFDALVAQGLAGPYDEEIRRLQKPIPLDLPSPDLQQFSDDLVLAMSAVTTLEERREFLRRVEARFWVGPEGIQRVTLRIPRGF